MSGHSIICKFMTMVLIICAIVAPVLTSEPLDKPSVIMLLVCILPWIIAGLIVDAISSAELETKIKFLEDRVKELEDKNK